MAHAIDIRALLSKAASAGPSSWAASPGAPVAVSFGGGLPDPATFPASDLADAFDRVLRRDASAALQYGGLMGYEGLRDYLAAKIKRDDGVAMTTDQIALTVGSAHALSLAAFAFVQPGDAVLIEAPTFPGSLRAIRAYGGEMLSVPVDRDGLDVGALEQTLKAAKDRRKRVKLFYTIPNFQNPSGTLLSLERRKRVVDLAERHGFLVLEDDAYGDLRYDDDALPSLLSLDRAGVVVRLGSFSKILVAGVRLGWAAGSPEVIAAMVSVRHDMGVSPLLARGVAAYCEGGRLERHIEGLRGHYRAKRDHMVAALGEHCGPRLRFDTPRGGFFIWAELAKGIDPERLASAAAGEGVGYVPGTSFFDGPGGERHLRLAFSLASMSDIERGVASLGRALSRVAH